MPVCTQAFFLHASLLLSHIRRHYPGNSVLCCFGAAQVPAACRREWVNPGCYVLIRYMALLFVPIGVGVMQYYDLLRAQFRPGGECSCLTLSVRWSFLWCKLEFTSDTR